MVLAILAGTKTQTRRVVKPQPKMLKSGSSGPYTAPWEGDSVLLQAMIESNDNVYRSWGAPGDRLWVRETFRMDRHGEGDNVLYRADMDEGSRDKGPWKPSIFMPRHASRLTLEVTDVRVQRVREISAADCEAEGCPLTDRDLIETVNTPHSWYQELWDSINGKTYPWDSNPFVWCLTFKVVK